MKLNDGIDIKYRKNIVIDCIIYISILMIYIFSNDADGNTLPSNLSVVLMMGCIMYYLLFKCNGGRVYFDKVLGGFGLFTVLCFLSVLYSEYKSDALSKSKTLLLIWIMSFVLYNYLVNTNNYKILINAMLLAGLAYSVYVIQFYGFSEYFNMLLTVDRVGRDITNVNVIGSISSTTFLLCIYFALYRKKYIFYAVSILPAITAFGSGSRKALASIVLSVFILLVFKYKREKSLASFLKIVFIGIIAFAILKYMLSLPEFATISNRFEGLIDTFMGTGGTEHSALKRELMTKYGLKEAFNHIVLGHGIGNSKIVTLKYFGYATYLHNNYVELLFGVGAFGLFVYYLMYVYLIKKIYKLVKLKSEFSEVLLSMLIIQLIMDYGRVAYYSKETYILIIAAAVFIRLSSFEDGEKYDVEINKSSKTT